MARAGKVNDERLRAYQEFCRENSACRSIYSFEIEEYKKIVKQESIKSRFEILDIR